MAEVWENSVQFWGKSNNHQFLSHSFHMTEGSVTDVAIFTSFCFQKWSHHPLSSSHHESSFHSSVTHSLRRGHLLAITCFMLITAYTFKRQCYCSIIVLCKCNLSWETKNVLIHFMLWYLFYCTSEMELTLSLRCAYPCVSPAVLSFQSHQITSTPPNQEWGRNSSPSCQAFKNPLESTTKSLRPYCLLVRQVL